MTTIQTNKICITINDNEPNIRRDNIIKAIAASIRWNSSCSDKYINDDDNVMVLAQLLEVLVTTKQNIL